MPKTISTKSKSATKSIETSIDSIFEGVTPPLAEKPVQDNHAWVNAVPYVFFSKLYLSWLREHTALTKEIAEKEKKTFN